MFNKDFYYKKYLKYKNKYINLLNDYQSNKNINEQILGGAKLKTSNTYTNIQNSSSTNNRTRSNNETHKSLSSENKNSLNNKTLKLSSSENQKSSSTKNRTRPKQKPPPPKNGMIIALNYIFKDSDNLKLLIAILTENNPLTNIDNNLVVDMKRKANEKKEYKRLINNLKINLTNFVKNTIPTDRDKLINLLGETLK